MKTVQCIPHGLLHGVWMIVQWDQGIIITLISQKHVTNIQGNSNAEGFSEFWNILSWDIYILSTYLEKLILRNKNTLLLPSQTKLKIISTLKLNCFITKQLVQMLWELAAAISSIPQFLVCTIEIFPFVFSSICTSQEQVLYIYQLSCKLFKQIPHLSDLPFCISIMRHSRFINFWYQFCF